MDTIKIMVILTVILWGVAPIFDKAALRGATPLDGTIIRGMVVGLIMIFVALFAGKFKAIAAMPTKSLIYFALSGLVAGSLGVFTYFKALELAPSSKIIPLAATYPLVTALLSVLFLGETLTFSRIIGIALICTGIFLVK